MSDKPELAVRNKILGLLLRDARESTGRTLRECGDLLGISSAGYARYEQGIKAISLPELETLAVFFRVPLSHFWDGELLRNQKTGLDQDTKAVIGLRQKIIGAKIRKARTDKGWSQFEMSDKLGIASSRLRKYELGKRPVPLAELEFVAEVLELPLSHFMTEVGPVRDALADQQDRESFSGLPDDIQAFVSDDTNAPYVRLAMKLADMPTQRLRQIAEDLLEITL